MCHIGQQLREDNQRAKIPMKYDDGAVAPGFKTALGGALPTSDVEDGDFESEGIGWVGNIL